MGGKMIRLDAVRLLLAAALLSVGLAAPIAAADPPVALDPSLYVIQGYDPARDPAADLSLALRRARENDRRVLIVVGGDWCVWCDILDIYLARNPDVRAEFANSFVILKVNMSQDNENSAFLSRFPSSVGYPDFFILDARGRYLGQQDTADLEDGRSYNRDRMLAFARRWRS